MDDLVERAQNYVKVSTSCGNATGRPNNIVTITTELLARIQALETSLAEAEGRVKDQIVNAIKTHQNFGDEDFGPGLDLAIDIATALETGEWKK